MSDPPAKLGSAERPLRRGRRRLVGVLAGCVVAAAAGAGIYFGWFRTSPHSPPDPPNADMTGADEAVVQAVAAARKQVLESPRAAAVWGRLGMLLLAHVYRAEAAACFAEAEILDAKDPTWPYLHAYALYHSSDTKAAVQRLERAVSLGGAEPAPRLMLGELLVWDGRLNEAEALFQQVLDKQAKHPRACLGLARVAFARQQWQKSKDYLILSETSAPSVRAVQALKAEVCHRLADQRGAQSALARLADLPDEFPWPDSYLEQVHKLQVGLKARISRAMALLQYGRATEAVEWMRATVQTYPQAQRAHFVLGRCLSRNGELAEAEKVFLEAVRLMPEAVESHFELGVTLQKQGKLAEAAERYVKVTERMPQMADAHLNRGVCLEELGRTSDALAAFRAAVRYQPEHTQAHRKLGELLAKMGKDAEALTHVEYAARQLPDDMDLQQLLEQVQKRAGRRAMP